MFELYQLRYFLAVVETGSFTKAAARACVTQPTLSAGIKKLEGQLDTRLFHRSSRRVFLTEAGTRFVDRAKSILFECNQAALELKGVEQRAVLRLGVLRTIPSALISRLLRDFRRADAGAVIELFEGTEQEIANRLDEGSIDLAITILRGEAGEGELVLFREGYRLALAADHPLAGRDLIAAHELAEDNMIVRTRCEVLSETSRHFTDDNVRPRLVYRTEQDERALAMVAAGLGVTVVPANYRHEGVVLVPFAGFDHSRTVALVRSSHGIAEETQELAARFEAFTSSQSWEAGAGLG
ncbi:MAG: LysR family transcriptional regulator [Proteobacteria bacterium]|nr:LysR family transcriptional regulator [Pseudomonadota bacterium]